MKSSNLNFSVPFQKAQTSLEWHQKHHKKQTNNNKKQTNKQTKTPRKDSDNNSE